MDQVVEPSVEDGLGVALLDAGAVVLDQLVRVEDVAADLAAEADVLGRAALGARARPPASPARARRSGSSGSASRSCLFDSCERSFWHWTTMPVGQVGDADGGVGLVHVLPPGSARSVRVDPEVGLVELDVDAVRDERADDHLRERRVASVRLVERREPHEPVDAALGLEDAVGVLAGDGERRRLETRLLAGRRLHQLGLEAAVAGPAQVHAQEHLRPVLSVGAAGAGVDRDDGVARVVLAAEERVLLESLELALERRESRLELVELAVV